MEFIEVIEKEEFEYSGMIHDLNIDVDHTYNINGYAVHNSAAGSLVVHLLGITKIDPIKYGLYFERFLNIKRLDPPDIDLDFDSKVKYKIEEYLKNRFGLNSVSHVISFGTFGIKNAIRDTFRVYYDTDEKDSVDRLSKCLENDDDDFDAALEKMIALEGSWAKNFIESHKKQYDIARILVGKNRHYSMHASGIVIAPDHLERYIPIMRIKDNIATGYPEGGDVRLMTDAGLMKFDILGLNACTIINDTLKNLNGLVNLDQIVANDSNPKVLEQFTAAKMFSIFQFEGRNITKFAKRAKPKCFADLVAINALYRPAVIQAGGLEMYVKNKEIFDENEADKDPLLKILKETYGIICYQEQTMRVFQELGGFSLAEADESRHIFKLLFKGKTDFTEFNHMMDKFRKGCHERTKYDDKKIDDIMELMKQFSKYCFNKCISGDSIISVFRKVILKRDGVPNACRHVICNVKISELFKNQHKYSGIALYDDENKVSKKVPIKEVIKTGQKETYVIYVKSGSKKRILRATLDHKFFTLDGWKQLRELTIGDEVLVKKGVSVNAGENNAYHHTNRSVVNKGKKYKFKNPRKLHLSLEYSNLQRSNAAKTRTINGHLGCKHSDETKELLRQGTIKRFQNGSFPKKDTSINKKVFEFVSTLIEHEFVKECPISLGVVDIAEPNLKIAIECQGSFFHADPRFYPDKNNLSPIQRKNKRRDFLKKRWMRQNGWTLIELWEEDINNNFEECKQKILNALSDYKKNPWVFEKIISIHKYGLEDTYDIHVDHPDHNYIANHFVVHNSHSCSYAMVAYIMMYLRTYHPLEYFSSLLSNTENTESAQDGKKVNLFQNYVTEIQKSFNIKIDKPDINNSGADVFRIKDGKLTYALGHIKDVGMKAAINIVENQPYTSFKNFLEKVTRRIVNKRVIRALVYSEAIKFDDTAILYEKEIGEKIDTSNFLQRQFEYTGLVASKDLKEATDKEYSLKGVENAAAQGKVLNKKNAIPIVVFVSKFRRLAGNSKKTGKPYVMYFATIYDGTTRIDDCILNDAEALNIEEGDLLSGKLYFEEAKNKKYTDHTFYLSDIKKIKTTEKYDALGKLNQSTEIKNEVADVQPEPIVEESVTETKPKIAFISRKARTDLKPEIKTEPVIEAPKMISRKKRVAEIEQNDEIVVESQKPKLISRKHRNV